METETNISFKEPWCFLRRKKAMTFSDFRTMARIFHGHAAPGLMIGARMVDMAQKYLPEHAMFDAICETPKCLPDAVQLLTPCTVGNGWLKILDTGRFALCLYDKFNGMGFRTSMDMSVIERWPEIKSWYFKESPKQDQNRDDLMNQIKDAGRELVRVHAVNVRINRLKQEKQKRTICAVCRESFVHEGELYQCRECRESHIYHQTVPTRPVQVTHHG